jgi:hypothetical protein
MAASLRKMYRVMPSGPTRTGPRLPTVRNVDAVPVAGAAVAGVAVDAGIGVGAISGPMSLVPLVLR